MFHFNLNYLKFFRFTAIRKKGLLSRAKQTGFAPKRKDVSISSLESGKVSKGAVFDRSFISASDGAMGAQGPSGMAGR